MALKFFRKYFAVQGDTQEIPDDLQQGGEVSFETGYGFDYERDPASDPLAKDVERPKMNWLLGVITGEIRQYQTDGTYPYITPEKNGGNPFPYARLARCLYTDEDDGGTELYESLVDNNTSLPTDMTKWKKISASALVTSALAINTLAPLTGGGPLTGNLVLGINASVTPMASYAMLRDSFGRSQVEDPVAAKDIVNKQTLEAAVAAAYANSLPDYSRRVSISVPLAGSRFTMPVDGFFGIYSYNSPAQGPTVYFDGAATLGVLTGAAYQMAPAPKGTIIYASNSYASSAWYAPCVGA
ncbi:hypothetical protein LJC36_00300 [Desulfovibrio sp. OttesenSCG-928-C14]|nr:hypothetical protein [Desulfovibrio sp. OttesenSCG-928-C14]